MTATEFLVQFDVLYNNVTSNQAPGLNGYEKSVFLTKAQDELVKNYFSATHNQKQEGYLDSPKREYDFSSIIEVTNGGSTSGTKLYPSNDYSKMFLIPNNVFIILNEQLVQNNTVYTIVPLDYTEFQKLMKKPYKLPLKGQAWKLSHSRKTNNGVSSIAEFIANFSKTGVPTYTIRYIRRLDPIILEDLETTYGEGLTIKGQHDIVNHTFENNITSPCELPLELHEELLQRAVELAKIAWQGDVQLAMTAGQRSE